jgi:MFS family permease
VIDRLVATFRRWNPFKTADARRLAVLFGVVYFSQGMWNLPVQPMTIVLKEQLHLGAGEIAAFTSISTIPWLIKPAYGLLSDFVPLWGRRRKSYFLLTTALASLAGVVLAFVARPDYWRLALLFTVMGLGLAFTDVLTDALMVENGRPLGLTGAFQSVQWASIYAASILVGVLGGWLAEQRSLRGAFALAACFPVISFVMGWRFVEEPATPVDRETFRATWRAVREAAGEGDLWLVAAFILFWTFSPSIGPALFYYKTDTLGFSQQMIGTLASLGAAGAMLGAVVYAPLSRRVRLRWLIVGAVVVGAGGTLAYLGYRSRESAMLIDTAFGLVGMMAELAFLDLAAKACPKRVEGTFFALLMSVNNLGVQGAQVVGGYLYDWIGYTPLIFISAAATLLSLAFVPLVDIDGIEARARAEAAPAVTAAAEA